jgi:predicted MFS family arabinose efflux permease
LPQCETPQPRVAAIVAQSTALVFIGYLGIGLEAAVVPTFVDRGLGLGATLAGLALGSQAFSTLTSRTSAGKYTDRFGARPTVTRGMLLMLLSGLLFSAATAYRLSQPQMAFAILLSSRLLLGWGISWVSAAGAVWGIGRAGETNASRILVWSGVAANGSLALGAPTGLWIVAHWSATTLGLCIAALYAAGAGFAVTLPDIERITAEPLHILAVLRRVAPYGSILAFAAAGYGVFAAFVTLFFQQQGWAGAAYPLALYGLCFVGIRVLLGKWIDHYSVFRVGLVSIGIELAALALLATSASPGAALASSCLMGVGFSLIFPALCIQTIRSVGPRDRASAISVFTGFIEFSLAVAAPMAGVLISHGGFRLAFWTAFGVVSAGFAGLWVLSRQRLRQVQGRLIQ